MVVPSLKSETSLFQERIIASVSLADTTTMQNNEANTMKANKEVSDEPTTEPNNEAIQEAIKR